MKETTVRFTATVWGGSPREIEANAISACAEFFGDTPHRIVGDYTVERVAGRTVGYRCDVEAFSDDRCMNPACDMPAEVAVQVFGHDVGSACTICARAAAPARSH